jgi:A/G-specific adenine glycosylase
MNSVIQQKILLWYKQHKRDLPWRKTDNPYYIVVSELMLQQTQVDRVIPKYYAFLKKFPTIQSLAMASAAEVIDTWAGLGYNRRALYLHKFAQAVTAQHDGQIPGSQEELIKLPGIGPYTSQAIRCFAFRMDVSVVDINIKRIYSRLFLRGEGSNNELNNIAREMIPHGEGVTWNNALMDFGATVCMDKPKCDSCPLQSECSAYIAGCPEKYAKPKTQSTFIGSNRYYRSLVIKALRKKKKFTLSLHEIHAIKPADKSEEWFKGIITSLERDGLIVRKDDKIELPQ